MINKLDFKYEHHKEAVERYIEKVKVHKEVLAVILSGSLAKGIEKENSDIDLYVVIDDNAYKTVDKKLQYCVTDHELCEYASGYIDAKLVSLSFLKAAVVHGSEPTRSSFTGSCVVYSKISEIYEIVEKIPVFQEDGWEERCSSYYAQIRVWGDYMYRNAVSKGNFFLEHRAVNEMVLFAGKYILCVNKVLFPCFKTMFEMIENCEHKPEKFIELSEDVLKNPTVEKVKNYTKMMKSFATVGKIIYPNEAVPVFIRDSEWNWVNGTPSIEDW